MKELSIEQKAKRYDEALEKSKRLYEQGTITESLAYIFPELKESKDDMVRKAIIEHFEGSHSSMYPYKGFTKEQILAWLEKQGEKIDIANKEYWRGYREGKQEILDKYAELEKQGQAFTKKDVDDAYLKGVCDAKQELEKQGEQKPANKVEPKFKVKYAGSEYNVFEIKDIAGVIFYGIEDEPNHIDYVKADNCEIISGYGIKEIGLSFPTKPVMFSEQKPAWSEEDDILLNDAIYTIKEGERFENELKHENCHDSHTYQVIISWLKSLKERVQPQNITVTDEELAPIQKQRRGSTMHFLI